MSASTSTQGPDQEKKHYVSFTVHIIESPSPDDFLSNRCEGALLCEALKLAGIRAELSTVVNKDTFAKAIKSIQHSVEKPTRSSAVPILHISAHGNKTSIGLTQDDHRLKWHDLAEYLDPLQAACKSSLLISMSTCMGYNGFIMSIRTKSPPYYALVGPKANPTWSDTLVAYITLYHNLIVQRRTLPKAVAAMNAAAGRSDCPFAYSVGTKTKDSFQKLVEKLTEKMVQRELEKRANTSLNPISGS